MRPRFVVTGTGRNGSTYIARLLTASGVPCGHEDWFGLRAGLRDNQIMPRYTIKAELASPALRLHEEYRRRRQPLLGDASWLAVPRLPRFRGLVLLQTRDPILSIASMVAIRMFTRPRRYLRFIQSHFDSTGNDLTDAMRWWVIWNQRARDYATHTYRLEDLDQAHLTELLDIIGVPQPSAAARRAFHAVDHPIHTAHDRGGEPYRLSWDDLPDGTDKEALTHYAKELGYDPP